MAISETITVNAEEAITSLDAFAAAAEKAAEKFAAAQDKIKSGLGGAGGSAGADKLAASMDKAAASVESAVGKINAAMDKLGGAADKAASGLGRLDEVAAEAEGSLSAAAAGADEAAAANDRLAASADDAGAALDRQAAAGARAGEASVASGAAGEGFFSKHKELILGTAVVMGYAVDKAMKFNSQMTLLQTQAGVSAKQMPALTKGVLELAGATGQQPGNLAESLYHVASNMESMPGTTTAKMLNMVKVAAEGAATGHANLVDVTNALTASVASGIPGVQNYQKAMGVLNATVGSGDMSMQDLADAMGSGMVAVVKGYGLNIKDVGAALATFGDNNIRGAKAGTDLRMAVQALAVPVSTAKAQLSALGMTQTTLAKDMEQGGLNKALLDLTQRFKENGITAKTEGQVITDLFGKKAGAGVAVLLEQMTRLESKYPALTTAANNFNKAWQTTQQTPQQKLKELEASAQALAITGGNVLMPAANAMLGGLNKAMSFVQGNAFASKGLALGAGTLVAGALTKGLFSGVESGLSGIGKLGSLLKIPGMDKLANLGKDSGAATMATAADGNKVAADGMMAASENNLRAAGLMDAGGAAGKVGGAAAGAEGAAAAEGAGAGLLTKGNAITAAIGVAIGAAIIAHLENKSNNRVLGNTNPNSPWNSWESNNSLGGKAVSWIKNNWGQAGPAASAMEQSQFQSRFGISVPGSAAAPKVAAPDLSALNSAKAKVEADMKQIDAAISDAKAAKLPAPDLSALESAKATIKADLNSINTQLQTAAKPPKVASPDMSALASAKATAAQQAEGIHTAAQTPVSKPVKAAPPDLSALAAAKGKAAADGAAMSAGLAQGILSEEGAVVAAANQVASAAAAAMAKALQVHSPSKVTQKIGAQTVEGLVVGLEGGQAAVTAAAQALGQQTAKAADVTAIDNAITKAIGYAGKDSALVKYLKADQSKLLSLAAQRQKLETEITDAGQIAQQAISSSNITGAGTYTPVLAASSGPLAASSTITGMQGMAADQKQFASVIGQLQKQGLNATSLSQLAQAGPSSLPQALGLAQGGKSAINQVNALEGQILASSKKLGNTAAPAMYQAGVDAAQGLAAGLKSQLGSLDATIQSLANELVQQIKKDLHISSPSQVFADIGAEIPAGLAQGIDGGSKVAAGAVSRMGASAAAAYRQPAFAGGGGGRGGGGSVVHNHYNVTVQGHVTTENNLLDRLQELQLAKADRNWQGGWQHPGRAG